VYNFDPDECPSGGEIGLGYTVEPSTSDSDIRVTALGIVAAMKEYREIQAASLFNKARTYDVSLVGDGQPLCSVLHAWEKGCWANTFGTMESGAIGVSLTAEALRHALGRVADSTIDDAGLKLYCRGRRLIVPVALMDVAERIMTKLGADEFPDLERDYIVHDYIESRNNWFIQTSIPGLMWAEWRPLRLDVQLDERGRVVVVGTEKRVFNYRDPRCIFGSCVDAAIRSEALDAAMRSLA
jgi:hypothetical protein